MRNIFKILIFVFFYPAVACSILNTTISLKQEGWISDFAGIVDDDAKKQINAIITEVEQKTSAEISVVVVKSLEGNPIEDFSVRLFEKWGIGKKGKNNGVLLIASIEDRKVKIEVGYGLEGILPDGLCGEILDTYVIPYFRQNNLSKGLAMGTAAIASIIAKDANVELTGEFVSGISVSSASQKKYSLLGILLRFLFFIVLFLIFIRHPFLFLLLLGSGGFRGGGFGGGGFSGGFGGFGGGMSGGGGASRGW